MEEITGQEAITWFCATLADLHCDTGLGYACFCDPDEGEAKDVRLPKKLVDFALMAIRDVSWQLRKDNDFIIPEEVLNEYMAEHAEHYQEEYRA